MKRDSVLTIILGSLGAIVSAVVIWIVTGNIVETLLSGIVGLLIGAFCGAGIASEYKREEEIDGMLEYYNKHKNDKEGVLK